MNFGGGSSAPRTTPSPASKAAGLSDGFGGLLGLAHEWADREKVFHSFSCSRAT